MESGSPPAIFLHTFVLPPKQAHRPGAPPRRAFSSQPRSNEDDHLFPTTPIPRQPVRTSNEWPSQTLPNIHNPTAPHPRDNQHIDGKLRQLIELLSSLTP